MQIKADHANYIARMKADHADDVARVKTVAAKQTIETSLKLNHSTENKRSTE